MESGWPLTLECEVFGSWREEGAADERDGASEWNVGEGTSKGIERSHIRSNARHIRSNVRRGPNIRSNARRGQSGRRDGARAEPRTFPLATAAAGRTIGRFRRRTGARAPRLRPGDQREPAVDVTRTPPTRTRAPHISPQTEQDGLRLNLGGI
ncbi:Hypothetical predicted protein [Podarcis lilfordi]|uniref:Uncharacterized protein n=1 Tax=Podarcis lilfordi TaxID=74358 RepID=A0AA35LMY9_9SAUR|nr:Hypothetical predicted protein [Podarcis lilfordi]